MTFQPADQGLFTPDVPAPARIYDFLLGGKDNYPADREAAGRAVTAIPDLPVLARANRRFLTCAVTAAVRAGVTQFLDLGSGLPTHPNVHETVQDINPDARVVYVDNDPVVLAHSRAERRAAHTGVVCADLRDPAAVLRSAVVRDLIDLTRPVAVLMVAVLHFCDGAAGIAEAYKQAVPSGSWLAISHAASDDADPSSVAEVASAYGKGPADPQARTTAEIAGLFAGWDVADPPGVADVRDWAGINDGPVRLRMPAGLAVKP